MSLALDCVSCDLANIQQLGQQSGGFLIGLNASCFHNVSNRHRLGGQHRQNLPLDYLIGNLGLGRLTSGACVLLLCLNLPFLQELFGIGKSETLNRLAVQQVNTETKLVNHIKLLHTNNSFSCGRSQPILFRRGCSPYIMYYSIA